MNRFMLRKLNSLVHQNGCKPDDTDSPMMQEVLLPGHLYLGVLSVKYYVFFIKLMMTQIDFLLVSLNK